MSSISDDYEAIQSEWNAKGQAFAEDVNAMVKFGETHGWENWKEKEPFDHREHLALQVISLLKKANEQGKVDEFRKAFPPAHAPFISFFEEQGQSIENLCFVKEDTIVFIIGTPYQKRQAFILNDNIVEKLSESIIAIGKSLQNEIFAVAKNKLVTTFKGWQGSQIFEFELPDVDDLPITQLTPFNDGLSVLLVSPEGIYLLTQNGSSLIHPVPDSSDIEWTTNITMEHADLSHNNKLIAVGDQNSDHRILDASGNQIAEIGPQSSYPHYALFSKNDEQIVLNSCHFYNGMSIGVFTTNIHGLKIEPYTEDNRYVVIDDNCRVYAATATSEYYIFGDANGYIRAFDKNGKKIWQYFLGSTITGMTISEDEKTLWVGSCTGIIHKLKLDIGQRDNHTIGNGNHYEKFRIIFWKHEPKPLIW